MRLTPADVHNVAFKKPSIGKRGYDEDEVDAFLDLVEAEFARLIEENNDLTQRLSSAGESVSAPDSSAQPADAVQSYVDQATSDHHHHEVPQDAHPVPAEQVTGPVPMVTDDTPAPAVAAAAVVAAPSDHTLQAARLLGLAQDTADRLTSEAAREAEETKANAQAESEKLLSDARTESDRMLTEAKNESEKLRGDAQAESDKVRNDARTESEALLTDAKNRSETMVTEATGKSEALERDSRVRAESMDREAQTKYNQVLGDLSNQRTSLEQKIDQLRGYEREYRGRLREFINGHLSQLEENDNHEQADNHESAAEQVPAEQTS